jgi:hypothetical protein
LNFVAKIDRVTLDTFAIDIGAMGAGEVEEEEVSARVFEDGVFAADLVIVNDDIVGVEATDIQNGIGRNFVDNLLVNKEKNRWNLLIGGVFHGDNFTYLNQ